MDEMAGLRVVRYRGDWSVYHRVGELKTKAIAACRSGGEKRSSLLREDPSTRFLRSQLRGVWWRRSSEFRTGTGFAEGLPASG